MVEPDEAGSGAAGGPSSGGGTMVVPRSFVGRLGAALTALSVLMLIVVLPLITTLFRTRYPWTDSWIMPAIGIAIMDVSAVLNGIAFFRVRERAVLGILAAVVSIPGALFVTLMIVGEGIAGV